MNSTPSQINGKRGIRESGFMRLEPCNLRNRLNRSKPSDTLAESGAIKSKRRAAHRPAVPLSFTRMGATRTQFDRKAVVEAEALATVRQLLIELDGSSGLEELAARGA